MSEPPRKNDGFSFYCFAVGESPDIRPLTTIFHPQIKQTALKSRANTIRDGIGQEGKRREGRCVLCYKYVANELFWRDQAAHEIFSACLI